MTAMAHSLTLRWMLVLGRLEGISLLLLLGVTMPLKYFAGLPAVSAWMGWIHGLLFMTFLVALSSARRTEGWSRVRLAWGLLAAALPLGTFVFERAVLRDPRARA
jgi:integral membrane protein